MVHFLTLDETAERTVLATAYGLMIDCAFDGADSFDHMFMSAGEGLGTLLLQIGAAEEAGSEITLIKTKAEITAHLHAAPIVHLPLVVDALDTLLMVLGQYGTCPYTTDVHCSLKFDRDTARLLTAVDLMDAQGVARQAFWLPMINRAVLRPLGGPWQPEVTDLIRRVAQQTYDTAPQDWRDALQSRPVSWCEGYLKQHWRYGAWLTPAQVTRSVRHGHPLLPREIVTVLKNGAHDL